MSPSPAETQSVAGTVGTSDDDTPVMAEADRQRACELSLARLRPPLKVPGYEQAQFLGRGAYGEVWKAVDSNSGRSVAIKYYSHRGGLDWSHMAREVEKLQYLFSDRYVVQLLDVGWEADPPYYVMEYMEYGSLADRLREGPMSVSEAVKVIRDVALGLVHAHDKGILHCDLKPGNIMLDQDGKPRLADFGQSRLRHEQLPALGTLFYMAPEQADLSATPDARWDVYALGAMFYRMITGEVPYLTEETATSLSSQGPIEDRLKSYSEQLRSSRRPTLHRQQPGVDKQLAEIIDRCLAVSPKRRYPNVQSVLHALALRESKRAQRPLLMLGLLGPALVVIVLSLVGGFLFQRTLETAQRHLLERTQESNQFAAKSVAARFALEVDKRWRILEQEAANESLRRWIAQSEEAGQHQAAVQDWLIERHKFWDKRFTPKTAASYWFIMDTEGRLRAMSPQDDSLLGTYFGYRDYFHGQGRQLSREDPTPPVITRPHRSSVFRSQPTNRPAVAFSVPIWSGEDDTRAPIAALVMEAELGQFAEFQGSRNQLAVLVDLRQDESGRQGLIVEHPSFAAQIASGVPLEEFYVDSETLAQLNTIHDRQGDSLDTKATPAKSTVEAYTDPVDIGLSGQWLASVEPVFVGRGTSGDGDDTGWVVLVQERRAETLQALQQVRSMVLYGGLAALALVVLIIASLWCLVVLVQSAPSRRRALRFWSGISTTTARSGSFGSASQSGTGTNTDRSV